MPKRKQRKKSIPKYLVTTFYKGTAENSVLVEARSPASAKKIARESVPFDGRIIEIVRVGW